MADTLLATIQPSLYHFQRQDRNFSQDRVVKAVRKMLQMFMMLGGASTGNGIQTLVSVTRFPFER